MRTIMTQQLRKHPALRSVLRGVLRTARKAQYFGLNRKCPICDTQLRKFLPFGNPPRPNARCPVCGSLERHRLMWLFLQEQTPLFDGSSRRLLHFAPWPSLRKRFEEVTLLQYLTADLSHGQAMLQMDITDIYFADDTFDVIVCSHVLEHVLDDKKALSELFRVLKPGGWAVLQVPVVGEVTFENPAITSPAERERLFGQHDHVRLYGRDFRDRLEAAGFSVKVVPFARQIGHQKVAYFALDNDECIYWCKKE